MICKEESMLSLHILGRTYFTANHKVLNLSRKSLALVSYLALEGKPHHREHLAELLWTTPDALANLRVELARLRQHQPMLFAARQPMLSLDCPTDARSFFEALPELTEERLGEWLSRLRGPVLGGLEDLGSVEFQIWVDHQKQLVNDRLEDVLSQLHARFERSGRGYAAELVRARAESVGLPLHVVAPPAPLNLDFKWPATVEHIRAVLQGAQGAPQLILLQGHLGFRRAVLEAAAENTPWHTVQLQGSAEQRLVQAALRQQLNHFMPPGLQLSQLPNASSAETLMQMGELVTRTAKPLIIALHDAAPAGSWLVNAVRYALDLPTPLVLVLSISLLRSLDQLAASLGQLDWSRVHIVRMTPLGIRAVTEALMLRTPAAHHQIGSQETLWIQAARLAQQSDGSAVYLRSALLAPVLPAPPDIPDTVRAVVLSQLADLPNELRESLSKLAQIHDRFSPATAAALLGDQAPWVLAEASRHQLLLNASSSESVRLPGLTYRSDDAEDHLTFTSELLRAVLAGTLPAPERRRLREILAEVLMPLQPEASRWYVQLVRGAAQRRRPVATVDHGLALLDLLDPAPPELAQPDTPRHASWPAPVAQTSAQRALPPQSGPQPRREVRSVNGYRVALEGGFLEVLRRGHQGQPPQLALHFGEVLAGRWTLVARLDVLRSAPYSLTLPVYALGVRTGTGPRHLYSVEPVADHMTSEAVGDTANIFSGTIPLEAWFKLSGEAAAGELELSLRAVDIALTIASMTWEHRQLLPTD